MDEMFEEAKVPRAPACALQLPSPSLRRTTRRRSARLLQRRHPQRRGPRRSPPPSPRPSPQQSPSRWRMWRRRRPRGQRACRHRAAYRSRSSRSRDIHRSLRGLKTRFQLRHFRQNACSARLQQAAARPSGRSAAPWSRGPGACPGYWSAQTACRAVRLCAGGCARCARAACPPSLCACELSKSRAVRWRARGSTHQRARRGTQTRWQTSRRRQRGDAEAGALGQASVARGAPAAPQTTPGASAPGTRTMAGARAPGSTRTTARG
jgi:hypothetical protein